jgi:3',5'-cyclic-AMP phosphodiesterase
LSTCGSDYTNIVTVAAWMEGEPKATELIHVDRFCPALIRNRHVELERGTLAITDHNGNTADDSICLILGASAYIWPNRPERNQDNAAATCPERGLLGTQLGPNKNGRNR